LKRTHSHSSNSFGHSGDNSGGNRTDWTDARPRKRQKQQPSYGFSDSDEEAVTLPPSSLPSAALTPDPVPNPQYAFLHALLTVVTPASLVGAKDWINHRTGAPGPSDKHAHALVFRIEELEWRLLLLVQEMDRLRGAVGGGGGFGDGGFGMRAGQGRVRIDPLGFYPSSLAAALRAVDVCGRRVLRDLRVTGVDNDAVGSGSEEEEEEVGRRSRSRVRSGKARARRNSDSEEEEEEEEEDDAGSVASDQLLDSGDDEDDEEEEEEDDEADGNQRRSGLKTARNSRNSHSRDSRNSRPLQRSTVLSAQRVSGESARAAARRSRLRSRNRVIDDWLGEEDGSDAYADLEDFLVA
jgi:hypothetical protein